MSIAPRNLCPGCGGGRLSASYRIARQPVVMNYRFATAAEARRVPRRDLRLRQCLACGLIFNAAFDVSLIPYDERYENRQCFSPAFHDHLSTLADDLITRHALQNARVLEVGCGKGDFLRLLCERAGARGVGYDTSYEGPPGSARSKLRFFKQYVAARDIHSPFDAIICRHVVEHIGPIGEFLRELCAIATAAGDPVTVIETPSFEWIARHLCFWDIFNEHCNYFTLPCLARLCEQAGFEVVDQRLAFGDQYQVIELKVRREARPTSARARIPVRLGTFARQSEAQIGRLEQQVTRATKRNAWAIWGAGAKGVALVNRLGRVRPSFVIDSNPAKQGCFIPGTRVPVIAPDDPRIAGLSLVLIANPNYWREITSTLRQHGFAPTILTT